LQLHKKIKIQAELIKKHKPDIVVFEIPYTHKMPFNKYKADNKPLDEYRKMIAYLKRNSKKYPQSQADLKIWENIYNLWREGKNTLVYNIDAPDEIRDYHFNKNQKYNTVRNQWYFWVYLFIREMNMAKHMRPILEKIKSNQKVTIAIFLELNHWKHVKFLLSNPSRQQVWDYYFKRFPELSPKSIDENVKKFDKMYYKYWKKVSLW